MSTFDAYVQVSVGETLHGIRFSVDNFSRSMEDVGIAGALVSVLKPRDYNFRDANTALAKQITGSSNLFGLARIDPWQREEALNHLRKAIEEDGLVGLHLNPWEENFSITDPMNEPLFRYAAERQIPVRIAAGYPMVSHAYQILEVAERYPTVRFLLTHCAQVDNSGLSVGDALALAERTRNTYFETSMVYRRDLIEDLVALVGPQRVLYGSNAPMAEFEPELERVYAADIAEEDRAMLLGGSLRGFLGLGDV